MSIADYINRVKSKPEAEKQRTVFLWTSFLIVVIFFVWLVTFSLSVANRNAEELRLKAEAQKMAEANLVVGTSTSPVQKQESFTGIIPQFYQLVSEGVSSVANGFWVIGDMIHK